MNSDMSNSFTNFTSRMEDYLTGFLWREWSTLGVAGVSEPETRWIIDPEVLLLLTTEIGRHDARLFDEVLGWLSINSRWISTQRLRTIHEKDGIGDRRVLASVARWMMKSDPQAKWRKLSQIDIRKQTTEGLFFHGHQQLLSTAGLADPDFGTYGLVRPAISLRSLSQPLNMMHPCALQLRLRALFGLGMRSDIVCYLLTQDGAHPSRIAQVLGYSQKRVQDTLVEMAESGQVVVRSSGRMKIYSLDRSQWRDFLTPRTQCTPGWLNWRHLASGLSTIWRATWAVAPEQNGEYVASSRLRTAIRAAQDDLRASGIHFDIEDDRGHVAENYLPVFIENMDRVLAKL
jgi:hypothetical protein